MTALGLPLHKRTSAYFKYETAFLWGSRLSRAIDMRIVDCDRRNRRNRDFPRDVARAVKIPRVQVRLLLHHPPCHTPPSSFWSPVFDSDRVSLTSSRIDRLLPAAVAQSGWGILVIFVAVGAVAVWSALSVESSCLLTSYRFDLIKSRSIRIDQQTAEGLLPSFHQKRARVGSGTKPLKHLPKVRPSRSVHSCITVHSTVVPLLSAQRSQPCMRVCNTAAAPAAAAA